MVSNARIQWIPLSSIIELRAHTTKHGSLTVRRASKLLIEGGSDVITARKILFCPRINPNLVRLDLGRFLPARMYRHHVSLCSYSQQNGWVPSKMQQFLESFATSMVRWTVRWQTLLQNPRKTNSILMVRQMVRNAYNRLKKSKFLTVRTTVRLGETRDSLLAPCQGINKVCQEVLADRHMIIAARHGDFISDAKKNHDHQFLRIIH